MPVTAKLSREFYEKFGDKIVAELVNWFNEVDATYRSDLRELNELNFSRFDAKLEQRLAEHDAKLEQRLAEYDAKWERRIAGLDRRLDELDAKWELRWAQLDGRFTSLEERLTTALANQRADLIRWMFLGWVTTLGVLIGLAKGLFG